ncbi:TetR/AcrR family transcriptional regulator [Hylemonella sp. W303a]|uniref:TetR/AcrR family transcriptional regulator n=1 Tax=Hylemonella sp. W303a TaxID=3389873 RepID=UPI00396B4131
MTRKAPRRTAERILETALALFNRYGEPQVSTGQIAAEMGISAGNLHYHQPSKDGLVNALFDRHLDALTPLLTAASQARDAEDAWFFTHSLAERIWDYRFLYRDLSLLLQRNRHVEQGMRRLLLAQAAALRQLLDSLHAHGALEPGMQADGPDAARDFAAQLDQLATTQGVLLSLGLSHDYALDPRRALEPEQLQNAVLRAAAQSLALLLPYLVAAQQTLLKHLLRSYQPEATVRREHPPLNMEPRHERSEKAI